MQTRTSTQSMLSAVLFSRRFLSPENTLNDGHEALTFLLSENDDRGARQFP